MFKINSFYIIIISVLVISQFSCKKYETEPLEGLTTALVYDTLDRQATNSGKVLNDLYSYLPNGFNRIDNNVLDAATDDAITSTPGTKIENLSLGFQSASQTVDDVFGKYYEAVRKTNNFLANIDKVPSDSLTKVYWKAEARFIRAMSYFELTKRYGGVPLIGDKIFTETDAINMPRNTYDECVQYIVSECDDITGRLRKEPLADIDLGRITRGAAIALKSRTLLYAASPLHNPNNDLTKWTNAAAAAKQLMDLNVYTIGTLTGVSAFRNAFVVRNSAEIILAFQRAKTSDVEKNNAPVGYGQPNGSSGYTSPTQDLVDAFGMITGSAINDNTSAIKFDPANPYANRDPRLDATVFYNGSLWLNRAVQTYEGGLDKPNSGNSVQTRTGYYMKKFMADFSTVTAYSTQSHNFPIFRYAEILLNYAEAVNESSPANTALAYTQLVAIRKRAGITAGTTNLYGLKAAMTQAQMRDAIRLERRLEMAFEEQRFWDVRRWKIADQQFNRTLHGVKITGAGTVASPFVYQYVDVSPIIFYNRMYLYPIPFDEVLKNSAIKQNDGY